MKDSLIWVGWMPFSSSAWHALRSAPAMTHTEVVPSPASMSAPGAAGACRRRRVGGGSGAGRGVVKGISVGWPPLELGLR